MNSYIHSWFDSGIFGTGYAKSTSFPALFCIINKFSFIGGKRDVATGTIQVI